MSKFFATAILFCLTMLSGCGFGTSEELDFNSRYIFDLRHDRRGESLTIVTSTTELGYFKDFRLRHYIFGGQINNRGQEFIEEFEMYDEEFFLNYSLVIFSITEPGTSFHHSIESVQKNGDITIIRNTPSMTQSILVYHTIVIELSNNDIPEQFNINLVSIGVSQYIFGRTNV